MRQTVRVTDKQPWSLGATSWEKHRLAVDNKLLPHWVIAARPEADPTETYIHSLSLEGTNIQSASDT